jgi:phosphate transport system substrate-binding protein
MKKRDYAPSAQKMAGNEQIASEVGKNANGIGYVGLAYTKASGVKVMAIDGALPSEQTVHAKTYPYARPLSITQMGKQAEWPKNFSIHNRLGRPTHCCPGWLCAYQIV